MLAAAACSVTGATTNGVTAAYVCTGTTAVVCSPGTAAYGCSDAVTIPSAEYSSLGQCSDPSNFGGATTYYCCEIPSNVSSNCQKDPSITTCGTSAAGYTCSGSYAPDSTDTTLYCGDGVQSGSNTSYCCESKSAVTSTCAPDTAITSCGTAVGYTCTGNDSPGLSNSSLNCGAGVPSNGVTSYCCYTSTSGNADAGTTEDAATTDDSTTTVDSSTSDDSSTTVDSSTSDDSSTSADATEEPGLCAVGLDTGNTTCDTCIEANCCSELQTCDVPDDAGVTGNLTACEHLFECLYACLYPSADSGQPASTLSDCQDLCGLSYSATAATSAAALATCSTTKCTTACQ